MAAASDYASFLRQHIDQETLEFFPVVEGALVSDDQQLVAVAVFEYIEVERKRLHEMIDGLAGRIATFLAAQHL